MEAACGLVACGYHRRRHLVGVVINFWKLYSFTIGGTVVLHVFL